MTSEHILSASTLNKLISSGRKKAGAAKRHLVQKFTRLNEKEIDICGAMPSNDSKYSWGDWYFCQSLKRSFERLGFKANVVPNDRWHLPSSAKYVLVLRGLKEYIPYRVKGRVFMMWNISHPDDVAISEYDLYDYIFFASQKMCEELSSLIVPPSKPLLQCFDPDDMTYSDQISMPSQLLFVGNSRGVYRKILKDLLPTEYDLTVYGQEWEKYPVCEYVKAPLLDHSLLGQAYHDAEIVLNDHWDDMKEMDLISNRIFDVLSVGGFVISDRLPVIERLFDGCVPMYDTPGELKTIIEYYLSHEDERKEMSKKGQMIVRREYTFDERAKVIAAAISELS